MNKLNELNEFNQLNESKLRKFHKPKLSETDSATFQEIYRVTPLISEIIEIIISYSKINDPFDWFTGTLVDTIKTIVSETNGVFRIEFSLENPNGIIAHKDEIYVCDNNNKKIRVFDKNLNFNRNFGFDNIFYSPCSLSIYGSKMYVTNTGGSIQIFSLKKEREIGQIICGHLCWGIYVYDSKIYVTSLANKIYIYSQEGEKLGMICFDRDNNSARFLTGICVIEDYIYAVDIWNDEFVRCYIDGTNKSVYQENTKKMDTPNSVQFIDGLIYINDRYGISQFDINGNFIKKVLFKNRINEQLGRSTDFLFLNKKCYVTWGDKDSIAMYE